MQRGCWRRCRAVVGQERNSVGRTPRIRRQAHTVEHSSVVGLEVDIDSVGGITPRLDFDGSHLAENQDVGFLSLSVQETHLRHPGKDVRLYTFYPHHPCTDGIDRARVGVDLEVARNPGSTRLDRHRGPENAARCRGFGQGHEFFVPEAVGVDNHLQGFDLGRIQQIRGLHHFDPNRKAVTCAFEPRATCVFEIHLDRAHRQQQCEIAGHVLEFDRAAHIGADGGVAWVIGVSDVRVEQELVHENVRVRGGFPQG